MLRLQPSPHADALWTALRKARDKGLTAGEAANRKLTSEPYARARLRQWRNAGFLRFEEGEPRVTHGRYFIMPDAPKDAPMVTAGGEVLQKTAAMKPAEFAATRRKLGVSATEMGRRLEWTGRPDDLSRKARAFEKGDRPIDEHLAAKVRALIG